MTASERIKELLKYKGLNVKTFSEFIGYERPQVLYDLINGKTRNVSPAMCDKIMRVMPEVNRLWLFAGEGNMLAGEEMQAQQAKMVPLVPISAIAGPLTAYYENGVDLDWCPQVMAPVPGADLALPITGDSMEPVFCDGSVVFIKRINDAAFIPWGHPLVIDTENGVYIKNVMPDEHDELYIWAESANKRYPPMHIPKRCITGMYRVLNVSKTFITM